MYPPVHRLLGWATRPSKLSLKRCVWRLDQLQAITYQEVLVKGLPAESDQATINRFPTLLDAVLVNNQGDKLGYIADLFFNIKTGNILYYLVSRSNPKLPGTSRWRFDLSRIIDQQPGCVYSNINVLDELPIIKSSLRQDFFKKSKVIKDNILEISNLANQKLEGWLDDNELDYSSNNRNSYDTLESSKFNEEESFNNINNFDINDEYSNFREYNETKNLKDNDEDPWI